MYGFNEQVYNTGRTEIKYVFNKGIINKDFLVVVFSGFNGPTAKIQNSYNYMRTLSTVDCNRLFILDGGPRGCYYLGKELDFEYEKAVYALITRIATKYNIKRENIICAGSSKGGTAALYYGIKYNYGYALSGVPQTYIADYIIKTCPDTTKYMLGENYTEDQKNQLNQLLFNIVDRYKSTKIYFYSSENDWQYSQHLVPLLEKLNEKHITYTAFMNHEMKNHADIANYYPEYMQNTLCTIFAEKGIKIKDFTPIDKLKNPTLLMLEIDKFRNKFKKK